MHVLVDYDKVTGAVACADCPPENITQIALVRVENRDFPAEVVVSDAQYVYREWDASQGVTDSTTLPFFAALIGEERYCGTSNTTTRAINSFCIEHYVEHPEEETETESIEDIGTETPPDVDPSAPSSDTPETPSEGGEVTPEQNDPEVE